MKIYLLAVMILAFFSISGYAYGIQDWESFRKMNYNKQFEVIDKLQLLAISIETTQRKLMDYKVTEAQKNQLKIKLDQMLVVMNRLFFVGDVEAAENNNLCMFAGWLADYTKEDKHVFCNISAIKTKSGNYSTKFEPKPKNNCYGPTQVPCHPMLFGMDAGGKLFCVDKVSAGKYYTNASAKCRDLSKDVKGNKALIIKNILKNPRDFLDLLKAIDLLCLCDVDGEQNANEYRKIIQKDGTCRSLTLQLHDLFNEAQNEGVHLFCEKDFQDPAYHVATVVPLLDKLAKESNFVEARKKFCTVLPIPTIVLVTASPTPTGTGTTTPTPTPSPTGTGTVPTVTPTPAPTGTGGGVVPTITPTTTPQAGGAILSLTVEWVENADKKTGLFKVKTIQCKLDGKTESKDCKLTYNITAAVATDETKVADMALDGATASITKKEEKDKLVAHFNLVSTKDPNVKYLTEATVPTIGVSDDGALAIALDAPVMADAKADVDIDTILCLGKTVAEEVIALPDCKVTWYVKKEAAEKKAEDEDEEEVTPTPTATATPSPTITPTGSPSVTPTATPAATGVDLTKIGDLKESDKVTISVDILDVKQTVTVVLTNKGKSVSSSQEVAAKETATPTPTATPTVTPTVDPTADADDVPPPFYPPQQPMNVPMMPMLLPGVF